jgi:hypothetical protein
MKLRGERDSGSQADAADPTSEMTEWASQRALTVSESTPGVMGPPSATDSEAEVEPPVSQSARPEEVPSGGTKVRETPRLLVLVLDEDTTDWGQVHVLSDDQEASRFIESLVDDGLDPGRIALFLGTALDFNVAYRAIVTIGQAGENPPEREQQRQEG